MRDPTLSCHVLYLNLNTFGSNMNARIIFNPKVELAAEHVAEVLQISIEKANQLLSRPDTNEILRTAIIQAIHQALDKSLQEMARIPHETVPIRRDCMVTL